MSGYIVITRSDDLYHYGILGMKWGQRNGPPYPLGYSQKNSREKKKVSSSNPENDIDSNKTRKELTDKQKKLIKIGAAVALTGLAVYGAYKLTNKNLVENAYTGILTSKEISNLTNNLNPSYPFFRGAKNNCGFCTLALEQRFRGDMSAQAIMNPDGTTSGQFLSYIKNLSSKDMIEDIRPNIEKASSPEAKIKIINETLIDAIRGKYPENSRGAVLFPTKGPNHIFTWVKNGEDVLFIDGQSGNKSGILDWMMSEYSYKSKYPLNVIRLDNAVFSDRLEEAVRSSSSPSQWYSKSFDYSVELGKDFVMHRF